MCNFCAYEEKKKLRIHQLSKHNLRTALRYFCVVSCVCQIQVLTKSVQTRLSIDHLQLKSRSELYHK